MLEGPTLHDAGIISGKSDSILGNLNMDFGGKADALQELVDLPGRAGDSSEE